MSSKAEPTPDPQDPGLDLPPELIPESEAIDWVDIHSNYGGGILEYWDAVRMGFPVFGKKSPEADFELIPLEDRSRCRWERGTGIVYSPTWFDRMVCRADLEAHWPDKWKSTAEQFQRSLLDIVQNEIRNALPPPRDLLKHRGGRPSRFDWDLFWIEITRYADTDGLPVRAKLHRHMMNYCAERWGDDAPSDSTVRERLARLYEILGLND
jgi:hypothetical protein